VQKEKKNEVANRKKVQVRSWGEKVQHQEVREIENDESIGEVSNPHMIDEDRILGREKIQS